MKKIIPQNLFELQNFSNWVAFKLINDTGQNKPRKMPINPKTGGGAKANEPDTWSTFENATSFAERNTG